MVELVARAADLVIEDTNMAEYQNIFTRVQVREPAYPGVELP
jgi:hypothetical protein